MEGSKGKEILGWQPNVDFKSGLARGTVLANSVALCARFPPHQAGMIGAGQSTYKNDFPVCSLPTAPGCNALAALRPLSLPHKGQGPATSMALRRLYFSKKVLWLPETTRPRLSAFPGSQRMLWPSCVRCLCPQRAKSSYPNDLTPSCTFHKKCSGYQRGYSPPPIGSPWLTATVLE